MAAPPAAPVPGSEEDLRRRGLLPTQPAPPSGQSYTVDPDTGQRIPVAHPLGTPGQSYSTDPLTGEQTPILSSRSTTTDYDTGQTVSAPDPYGTQPVNTHPPAAPPPPSAHPPAAPPPPAAAPPPAAPPPAKAALLSQPGAYEEWIKGHSGIFDEQSRTEALTDQYQPEPSAISGVKDIGPGIFQEGAQGYVDALSGAGAAETLGATDAERLGGTLRTSGSAAMGVAGQANAGLSDKGAMEALYGEHGNDPWQTGMTEDFAKTNRDLADKGAMESFYGSEIGDVLAKSRTEKFADTNHSQDNAGDMEAFYQLYGGDPMEKGYTEQLYESGIGQLDPYYDYASKRAIQGSQTASAARGGFNSGLAAQQESDILGNLRGQQASKWVDLAPIADSAKLDRERLGGDWAQSSQSAGLDRYKALLDASKSADDSQLAQQTLGADMARSAQDSEQNRFKTQLDAYDTADDNKLGRETLGFDAARSAQDSEQNRYKTLSDVASAGDAADLGLTNARITADKNASDAALERSRQAEEALINRTRTSADISRSAEQQALDEWIGNKDLAGAKDSTDLALRQEQMDEARAADDLRRRRLLDQGDAMQDLQTAGQNRLSGALNSTTNLSNEEINLIKSVYGDMSGVNALDDTWLQAEADKWGISAQQMKDIMGMQGAGIKAVGSVVGL